MVETRSKFLWTFGFMRRSPSEQSSQPLRDALCADHATGDQAWASARWSKMAMLMSSTSALGETTRAIRLARTPSQSGLRAMSSRVGSWKTRIRSMSLVASGSDSRFPSQLRIDTKQAPVSFTLTQGYSHRHSQVFWGVAPCSGDHTL